MLDVVVVALDAAVACGVWLMAGRAALLEDRFEITALGMVCRKDAFCTWDEIADINRFQVMAVFTVRQFTQNQMR